MSLPAWARGAPDRLLFTSNESGRLELHAWDRSTGARRQVTDRPEGTTLGALDPEGATIWWFDDERGNELGTWRTEPFGGGEAARPAAPGIEPGYDAGLAVGGRGLAVVGTSTGAGSRIWLRPGEGSPALLYAHREDATVTSPAVPWPTWGTVPAGRSGPARGRRSPATSGCW